jgi:hypothetical protein
MAWPAIHPTELDSLPVSNYPMFAHPRERTSSFASAVFVDGSGEEGRLDPSAVSGTDQPMQAAMTLRQAFRDGSAHVLCAEIAADLDTVGTVLLVTERYDTIAWFRGERDPVERSVHAQCTTGGGRE